jgi:5'-3' exonuclease
MGIKYLNSYLQRNCRNAISCVSLEQLNGKKIAIDVSIYMYKYEADGLLLENMYLFISIMRYYNIIPIFIFDGKAPAEKKDLIQKRSDDRVAAEKEIKQLKNLIENNIVKNKEEKQEIINTIEELKKKTTYISKSKIQLVKDLMRAYGMTYFDAHGEADQLCAMLTITGKVWACMSEDMDMFVYGCPRVLRYLSLVQHNIVIYETNGILQTLNITQNEFRDICVLSGTDYNIKYTNKTNVHFKNTIKYFKQYKEFDNINNESFYTWLTNNTNYIKDNNLLRKIHSMFDITSEINNKLSLFDKIMIENGPIKHNELQEIMSQDGFIFIT